MNSESRKIALVFPHTHWDRAWYWPFERFRAKLCECFEVMIAMLREHPDYHFNCDGQTLMIEDYLEVCPENRAVLQGFAAEGRLHTGPMYCLSDVYCSGAESLIRNLLIGMAWSREFGGLMRIVHMPDTFGITPNLPAICAGFGIQTFTFMRGHPEEVPDLVTMNVVGDGTFPIPATTRMFRWRSPDGAEVRVFRLRDGYANACALGRHPEHGMPPEDLDKSAQSLEAAAAKQDDAQGEPLGLMAGVDHQIPQSLLPEVIRRAEAAGRYTYRFAGIDALNEWLEKKPGAELPVYEGEFHGRGAASVLGGTLSTRIYLKSGNAAAERALVQQAEPSAALAAWLGRRVSAACTLSAAWKQLLQTHPHDDICGCSVDAVHRSNEQQMEKALFAADAIRRCGVIQLFREYGGNRPGDSRPSFLLMNTQAVRRSGLVDFVCDFEGQRKWGDTRPARHYRIVDEEGRELAFREIGRRQSSEHPRQFCRLEVHADLPPMTFRRFYLERTKSGAVRQEPGALENEHLKLEVDPSGCGTLTDKATGKVWSGLGQFSGQADIGDSYDFSDIPGEPEDLLPIEKPKVAPLAAGGGLQGIAVEGFLRIPASTDSRKRRRSRRMTSLPVRVEWILAPGSRHLEVRLVFTNTASDHRLRWNLAAPFPMKETLAGLNMQTVRRPAGSAPAQSEPPRIFPEHPGDEFVAFRDKEAGLACFSQFPFNFEVAGGSRLAITVLRSVGYLTNPTQMATRLGTHAGPHIATPEAQCLGRRFDFRFAIRPFAAADEDLLLGESLLWRAEPIYGQMDPTANYVERVEQPDPAALVEAEARLFVSACKPSLDGRDFVIRFFNPAGRWVCTTIRFAEPVVLVPCGLDEIPCERATPLAERHAVELAAKGFRTFRVRRS
jgi:hypothetical protein